MRTLIFRTAAPYIASLMVLFSIFVLLRGHNEPGGGFIGGLIAASAAAVYGIPYGVPAVRKALYFHPMAISGSGLLLAALSGVFSIFHSVPLLTGIWGSFELLGTTVDIATVITFDIGVYLVVLGSFASIALGLEEREDD
jgi:multicomponent Na+:H+ antiporter subunit B